MQFQITHKIHLGQLILQSAQYAYPYIIKLIYVGKKQQKNIIYNFPKRKVDGVKHTNPPLVSMKKEKRRTYRCGQRTVRLADCGMQPKAKHSLRAQAQLMRTETVKTLRLKREKSGEKRTTEVREQAFPSRIHEDLSVRIATFN
ncbi:hypothetical protein TNCV_4460601 [Trichonephila clavipes]|nr:hypothetical protein TNCV_4460601 [Trichonephila clavipes]